MNDLINRSLPKWPQMIVTGKTVTIEQAKDIIFKTDDFLTSNFKFSGGNNREFNDWYRNISGLSQLDDMDWKVSTAIREAVGHIETEYVNNSWASCAFIFGPHGWCHPSGKIEFSDNVGKWPTINDILDEWTRLAEAFPYIDLNVTLMDGEDSEDESNPVVNIKVKDGIAELQEPDLEVHKNYSERNINEAVIGFAMGRSEQGLPTSWIIEYAGKVKTAISEYSK